MLMDSMVEWEIERGLMDHDSLALVSKIKIEKMTCLLAKLTAKHLQYMKRASKGVDQCSLII